MKLVVVYNPKSGSALSVRELKDVFTKCGHVVEKLVPLGNSLSRDLKPYIVSGATVAVVGGDGSINSVAQLLVGTKAVLAPLPGGTLNHFTKDLNIPQNLDDATRRLSDSKVYAVDVASVNDTLFLNNSSIGLYPSSLAVRSRLEDKWGKWPAAVIAAFRTLMYFRTYNLRINDKEITTPFVFVGNNMYHLGTLGMAERKKINQGMLSVFVARTVSRRVLLKIALFSLIGKAHTLNEFDTYETALLQVEARHPLSVSYDGEMDHMSSRVEYSIHPGSLKVRY